MENNSSKGFWKFLAILFGTLLAGAVGFYIYKQKNPEYDPWEEPWENSSSPVNLDSKKHQKSADDSGDENAADENTAAADAD
jgi:hypothetical protein